MLLVSTLARANANQDPILGLLCGSAINNDGHSLGTMTPSPAGQEAVLRAAYTAAAIPPETISYIEAHATGTRIGDVVEARALTRCFPQPPAHGVRYLGGVKPNVGHLLSAAAMPSLLKVLLALQHRQLPPTLHCEQVRPIFKLDQAGLTLNRSLVDWTPTAPGLPLRAGVSSFGFGGTNAHVILEEAPPLVPRAKGSAPYAFARTPYWIEKLEDRGRRTEDGEQKTEDRWQMAEGGQKTEGRGRRTDGLIGATGQSIPLPPIEPAVDGWLQRVGWEAAPLWHRPVAQRCCGWRLLATATPAAQKLAERLSVHLQAQGVPCSEPGYLPNNEAALDEWLAAQAPGWGLVFVGDVGDVEPLNEQAALAAGLDVGLFRFQQVAQRLVRLPATQQPAGLWLVTAGAHGIEHDDEAIAPERAALAGLAFALNDELPTTPCCVVDLAPSAATDLQVAQVAAELGAEPTRAVIAWRRQQGRWTRCMRQLAPLHPTSPTPLPATLRKGVYLITGGASGIGAALARSLADLGMTLVLTGRTPLTRDPQRAALVMALRKRGVTVEYIVADITQASEVATLLEYICQLYGPPVGVIHAAGIVRPQPLRSKSQADMAAVLAPKVIGAWLLAQELERRAIQPTYFVLFSSIAALLPGFGGGVSDYVAANAFLDALAATERRRGVNCTVINWSIWAETGMAAQPALLHHWAAQGLAGLTSSEGLSAFYRALSLAERQVVVCKPQASATTLARQSNAPPALHLGKNG